MDNTSELKTGERKRKASPSTNNSSTFVWAREGNHEGAQEHAAYLLQTSDVPLSAQLIIDGDEDNGEYEYVYVRWCSTGTISRIRKDNVSTEELSSRRCRRAASATATRQVTKSKSRLSLSKKQRQHWRDQQKVQKRQKSGSENKLSSMECDVISIGSRSSRIGPLLTVSVDESTNAGEEKKDDDEETILKSSKQMSSLPRNALVREETKPQLQQQQQQQLKKDDNVTLQSSKPIFSISCNPLAQERGGTAQAKPQLDKNQQQGDVTMQSNKTIPALSCNPSAKEKDSSVETKPVHEQNETSLHSYTYRSSAYVQHLAEACTIIMSDARWQTLKQSGNSSREVSLFSWEEGDDLSAVKAFLSLYEDPTNNQEAVRQKNIIEDDLIFERAMNLYSRIYHRKGPWLDLADLYVRYYAPKVSDDTEMESERSNTSFSNHQSALKSLFVDILRLESMGLVRSFESEYECGTVAGQVRTSQGGGGGGGMKRGVILSAEERKEVLRMLGGGKSPKAGAIAQSDCTNEVLAQMQSQKTLISAFAATKSKTSSLLPVRKHVDKVLLRKLASKVVSLSKSKEGQVYTRRAEVEMALKMIESEWKDATTESPMQQNQSRLMSTLRLREAPLLTLRRVMRLFLCAGGGPGSMRGDGTNGWRSCLVEGDWHKVEYPGLNSRFGLEAYPLRKYFAAMPEHNSVTRVFESLNEFRLFEIGVELRSSIDQASEAFETEKMIRRRSEKSSESESADKFQPCAVSVVDVWHLLTKDGRRNLVNKVLSCLDYQSSELELMTICQKIEDDVHQLDAIRDSMSEHESLILCTSIVCRWLLQVCIGNWISSSLRSRPWLRHLSFDAILTYIVWDGVPFLEKRGLYLMASSSLTMILFGTEIQSFCFDGPESISNQFQSFKYAQYLLPRRNRGKAIERLLIDLTHAYRKSHKEKSHKTTPLELSPIQGFCRLLLSHTATSNSIPFSSIRNLARRLKVPLIKTMDGLSNDEMQLLHIRLDNVSSSDKIESCSGYRDWSPETDVAVANAISNDREESGKRCAFVGWESNDHDNRPEATRSLNVEELALELYHSATLPNNNDKEDSASNDVPKGGWEGWHNEGGHARKLFRIIFLQAVLDNMSVDDPTVFLTPYQHSPHDLHVGYQKVENDDRSKVSLIHGFYERRRNSVEAFLSTLSQQTDQSISDLVYFSVKARWDSHSNDESRIKDVPLLRDVAELRTLSMVAAGLGGQALSSMFRALAFDYRHYSGGLPDLLLARARYHPSKDDQFVDLSEWIGEAFCKDYIEEENLHRSISMLADKDDDFLGCSKNVDSSNTKFSSKKKRQKISVVPEFPSKVQLEHDEKQVIVDCLWVEVKSANDRLDSRQEDWLNIIDSSGNARVCKFGSKKQSK